MFYLLHGNDEFTCREHLKQLRQEGDFAYNQDRYTGGEGLLSTITPPCNTSPSPSEQRLVIIDTLPKKRRGEDVSSGSSVPAESAESGGKGRKKKGAKGGAETRAGFEKGLAEAIPNMPDTTVLIVLVDEE